MPTTSGTQLISTRTDGSLDSTYGPACVIGGPTAGYGNSGGYKFSNAFMVVDGIGILFPCDNTSAPTPYAGLDLFGMASARIDDFAYAPVAVFANNAGTYWMPLDGSGGVPSYTFGLRMPTNGNDRGNISILRYVAYKAQYGLICGAHEDIFDLRVFNCQNGLFPQAGEHGVSVLRYNCENTPYPVFTGNGSSYPGFNQIGPVVVNIAMADLESFTLVVNDNTASLRGTIYFQNGVSYNNYYSSLLYAGGFPPGFNLIACDVTPQILAPSMPASGTAFPNYYYRPATVNVQPGTATVSAVAVDGTTLTGITSGPVRVQPGHSITLTYSGGTPAWQWVLD